MDWLKLYSGTTTDAKWLVVARRAQCRPGDVACIWVQLLEAASQARPRGSILRWDAEAFSDFSGYDLDLIERVVEQFRERGLITDDSRLTSWAKRNGGEADPTGAERQRRYRAKKKERSQAKGASPKEGGEPAESNEASRRYVTNNAVTRDCRSLDRQSEALAIVGEASAASSSCSVGDSQSKSGSTRAPLALDQIEQKLGAAGVPAGMFRRAWDRPKLSKWVARGVTGELLDQAIELGRAKRIAEGSQQPLNVGLLDVILGDLLAEAKPAAPARAVAGHSPPKPEDRVQARIDWARHMHQLGQLTAEQRDAEIAKARGLGQAVSA